MNTNSSRSHSLFYLHVSKRSKKDVELWHSKLTIVDLAGSERVWSPLTHSCCCNLLEGFSGRMFCLEINVESNTSSTTLVDRPANEGMHEGLRQFSASIAEKCRPPTQLFFLIL